MPSASPVAAKLFESNGVFKQGMHYRVTLSVITEENKMNMTNDNTILLKWQQEQLQNTFLKRVANSNSITACTSLLMKRSIAGMSVPSQPNAAHKSAFPNVNQVWKMPPTPLELCLAEIEGTVNSVTDDRSNERWQPDRVHQYVINNIEKWGKVTPIHPEKFLQKILQSRGYETSYIPVNNPKRLREPPSAKQTTDYDNDLVWAIRNGDMDKLKALQESGKTMAACNKYSESILHMACRRSEKDLIEYLLSHGANSMIEDDCYRTILHDVCWRAVPRLDIVTVILDLHKEMMLFMDKRGAIPLQYVREEHWNYWCAYLYHTMDKYWPMRKSVETVVDDSIAHEQETPQERVEHVHYNENPEQENRKRQRVNENAQD